MNLLDDSLLVDRARDGQLTDDMRIRFVDLGLEELEAATKAQLAKYGQLIRKNGITAE